MALTVDRLVSAAGQRPDLGAYRSQLGDLGRGRVALLWEGALGLVDVVALAVGVDPAGEAEPCRPVGALVGRPSELGDQVLRRVEQQRGVDRPLAAVDLCLDAGKLATLRADFLRTPAAGGRYFRCLAAVCWGAALGKRPGAPLASLVCLQRARELSRLFCEFGCRCLRKRSA